MVSQEHHWEVSEELAKAYSSPLDRRLFCDNPLINLLGDISHSTILDLGCGNGGFTSRLARAKKVVGIDTSDEMLQQARALCSSISNISFEKAAAEQLPFDNGSFQRVVASMLINTVSQKELVDEIFLEAWRVLAPGGKMVISTAHPLTLDKKTVYRWTKWKTGQSQLSLQPGEEIIRQFRGKDERVLTVSNYYWPPHELTEIARKAGFAHIAKYEPRATYEDLAHYPDLDPALVTTPFFLLMTFDKKCNSS